MVWARVDDGWWCHPKVIDLDLDAKGLWVSVLSWSCQQQTDHVPDRIVAMCGGDDTVAGKLVDAGLWDADENGYVVHDWDDYQSERAKKAAAGHKGGRKSGESRRAKAANEAGDGASREAETGASDEAGPSRPDPTQPDQRQTPPGESDDEDPSTSVDEDLGFEDFWTAYPKRKGRRVGKEATRQRWRKLTIEDRRAAYRAAVNYARACEAGETIAKDPERFINSNRVFEDWLAEADAHSGEWCFIVWCDQPVPCPEHSARGNAV